MDTINSNMKALDPFVRSQPGIVFITIDMVNDIGEIQIRFNDRDLVRGRFTDLGQSIQIDLPWYSVIFPRKGVLSTMIATIVLDYMDMLRIPICPSSYDGMRNFRKETEAEHKSRMRSRLDALLKDHRAKQSYHGLWTD